MPEGDTIHRAASELSRALAGKTVARLASRVPAIAGAGLAGKRVVAVDARGKWLAIHFDDGHVILSHMRMHGRWRVFRTGQRWSQPEHLARVVIEVEGGAGAASLVAVCFAAPTVRLVTEAGLARDLAHLGEDATTGSFDLREAARRLRTVGGRRAIGDAIMDQRALAGVGNVYKSEVLFAERVSPLARTCDLDEPTLERLAARANAMLLHNRGRAPRTTTAGFASTRLAVYDRTRLPCPRCGTPIARVVQGSLRRATYYCPECQKAG